MAHNVRDLLAHGAGRLSSNPLTDAHLEASILLAHLQGKQRSWLFAHPEAEIDDQIAAEFEHLVTERLDHIPIAYLVGEREFWSLRFRITRDTLIPRPETELLVEQALAIGIPPKATVADLGTGSGAIAAALASEQPHWEIVATDISHAALDVAAANFRRLGLTNVACRNGIWLEPLCENRFDLIVSNPPYVAENDPHLVDEDIRAEPRHALVAGIDGLDALREIIPGAYPHLREGGWLLVEHGWDQAAKVQELFRSSRYKSIKSHKDFGGQDRVTGGRRINS